MTEKHNRNYLTFLVIILMFGGLLTGCSSDTSSSDNDSATHTSQTSHKEKKATSTNSPKQKSTTSSHKVAATNLAKKKNNKSVLSKLVTYTNEESAGPTSNYYWDNGKAQLTGFKDLKAGDYHFSSDSLGRSATAKAVLTYSEYQSSQGSRQGSPLAPPSWPDSNPKVAINYGLTGRTYHGYLYNRSHSIADSLLGEKSYTSEYNFTTGTRPQNVGADQNGGMRYAEEMVENYWNSHNGTNNTVSYQTTPLYKGSENIPRGSVIDIKSSDNYLNKEIVVINSVEGIKVNYDNGSSDAKDLSKVIHSDNSSSNHSSQNYYAASSANESNVNQDQISTQSSDSTNSDNSSDSTNSNSSDSYSKNGQWYVAAAGMVFLKSDSHKYYSEVTNKDHYIYESQSEAVAAGGEQAPRGNQYARP